MEILVVVVVAYGSRKLLLVYSPKTKPYHPYLLNLALFIN